MTNTNTLWFDASFWRIEVTGQVVQGDGEPTAREHHHHDQQHFDGFLPVFEDAWHVAVLAISAVEEKWEKENSQETCQGQKEFSALSPFSTP